MPSLIEEIQQGAIDQNVRVDTLLRQMKLAAVKLKMDQIEEWVSKELEGYKKDDLPEYRILHGTSRAWNPYRGWIPIVIANPKVSRAVSTVHCSQAIGTIIDLVEQKDANSFHYPMSDYTKNALNKNSEVAWSEMVVEVARGSLIGIVDKVRDKALDWAASMEREGIIGNGISFSAREKAIAAEARVTNINIGTIGSLTGSIGNENTIGNIAGGNIDLAQSRQLVGNVLKYLDDLAAEGADRTVVGGAADAISSEHEKASPDESALRKNWEKIRTAILGGTGGLLSGAVKAAIDSLIGAG
ncbi:MAG: hypothetical protein JNK84_14135 [Phreatobacter sp.]|uniref:AbiTii domain-containing protein n=1 Tax=Phreatobacter sp. TaxID=1966341 RepID=UPI001A5C1090|nr:hypothetical protein [Phreatobacter sp.]MBL8570205.1 hypothetical protein [Phreatobacter sp.]